MNCTKTLNKEEAFLNLQYEVIYTGNYVDNFKSMEKIVSDNEDLLETYQEQVEEQNELYREIEYYNYNVSIEGNTLINAIMIDYSKIDTAKMIEVDKESAQIIQEDKVKIDTMKNLYEQMEFTCEIS